MHPRIHNFLWRAVKNILPTRDNLMKKGIHLDNLCPFCHNMQSVQHIFISCDFAKHGFFASVLCYRLPQDLNFMDWLQEALSCGDFFSAQALCTILHGIWVACNNVIFRKKVPGAVCVAQESVANVVEFNN